MVRCFRSCGIFLSLDFQSTKPHHLNIPITPTWSMQIRVTQGTNNQTNYSWTLPKSWQRIPFQKRACFNAPMQQINITLLWNMYALSFPSLGKVHIHWWSPFNYVDVKVFPKYWINWSEGHLIITIWLTWHGKSFDLSKGAPESWGWWEREN